MTDYDTLFEKTASDDSVFAEKRALDPLEFRHPCHPPTAAAVGFLR